MPSTSKEDCHTDLRLRILRMELEPGVILDEASLSRQYGMSRTPLREVLQRLAGAGYITLADHRGAKVASMDVAVLRIFFQTAPMIYANISRLAAEHRTARQMDDLQKAQDEYANSVQIGRPGEAVLANHRFHALIGDMAHNPYLSASLDRLLIDHTRLSQTFYRPATEQEADLIDTASQQHEALIAAIAARDAVRAVELTLQHWDLSRDRMERFVRPDPLPVDLADTKDRHHAV